MQVQATTLVFADLVSGLGGLLDIPLSGSDYDPDEAEFQRQQKINKRKSNPQKRRGNTIV